MGHIQKRNPFIFWLFTGLFIILSHHLMVFLHEWTHGFVAWIAGYKSSPFAIHYPTNWITLWGIDEAVPYQQILAAGKNKTVAMIAIAPMIDGAIFFLIGLGLLASKRVHKHRVFFSFVYWWTLMEISEIFSYIPVRTFFVHDDIFNFTHAAGISPWIVFILGTPFVIWGLIRMIRKEEVRACKVLYIRSRTERFFFLFITVVISFWYYGGFAFVFVYPQILMNLFSWIALGLIPVCMILLKKRYTRD